MTITKFSEWESRWHSMIRYKPQVDLGSVIDYGNGWRGENEKPLISVDVLCRINDIVRSGRKCNFREGFEPFTRDGVNHMHYWLRWFHVPNSYLITIDIFDSVSEFEQTKNQLDRYLHCLKSVVYPLYRREEHIEWSDGVYD